MTLLDYYQSVRGSLDYDLHSNILFKKTLKSRTLGDVDSKYLEPTTTAPIFSDLPVDVSDVSYKTAYVTRPSLDLVEDQRQKLHLNCKRVARSANQWAYSYRRSGRAQSAHEAGARSAASSRPVSRPQSGHTDGSSFSRPKSSPIRVNRLDSATSRQSVARPISGGRPVSGRSVVSAQSQRSERAPTPSVRSRSPRSNLKRSRTLFSSSSVSSRQEPPDPVYARTTRALTDSRAKIRSHHNDRNHDLNDGIFVRGKQGRESSAASSETAKQWLSFGGGVRNSAGVVEAFAVMKNPDEYYSIEGQSGLAVAKHLRKMDKVLIGINGNPSPNFANRLEGKRVSDKQAEELRVAAALTGESVPLCWDDQLTVPEVKTVDANPQLEPTAPKPIPRETTAVVFHKLETERPLHRHLICPTKQQTAEAGFRVQRRQRTFTKPSATEAEAIMTIVSIDAEKLDPDAVDYEAFIDEKIPTKQFTRRRHTPDSSETKPSRSESRSARSRTSQALSTSSGSNPHEPRLQVRTTSRSIRMEVIDDDDFAVRPVRQRIPSAPTPTPRDLSTTGSGKLRRGKSNLGKTAPSIGSRYDQLDASYIKFTGSIASPSRETPRKPPTSPEHVVSLPVVSEWGTRQSETEDETTTIDLRVPAPSLNDESELETGRPQNEFDVHSSSQRRGSEDSSATDGVPVATIPVATVPVATVPVTSQEETIPDASVAEEEDKTSNGERADVQETKSSEPAITIPVAGDDEEEQGNEAEAEIDEPEAEIDEREAEVTEVEAETLEADDKGAEIDDPEPEVEKADDEPTQPETKEPEVKKEKRLRFDL